MADLIRLEIVTPTGVAYSRDVAEVDIPTLTGEVGVLPGHVPTLFAIRIGIVTARPLGGSDEPARFAVAHGVLEVTQDKAILLAERFARKEDIDVVATRARFKEVDDEVVSWTGELDDPKRNELIEEEQWLATALELIGDPPPPAMRELTRFQAKEVDEVIIEAVGAEGGTPEGLGESRRE
ncbi:MAG: ATP synthase F1 subunit epsilon [Polyangiaceae bacterium]|jgi:F-type H+-transporting ATPase subunit epsilon|nr:ATP synthase F1 subunit epsilon [Polyangiaceae bacterium]